MTRKILFISLIVLGLSQFIFGQQKVPATKKKLVTNLVTATEKFFPYQQFDSTFQNMITTISGKFERDIGKEVTDKIDSNKNLEPAKKIELRSKVPALMKDVTKFLNAIIGEKFRLKVWVSESSNDHFTRNFTAAELKQLTTFFNSPGGKNAIMSFNQILARGMEESPSPINSTAEKDFERNTAKILKTAAGKKFFSIITDKIMDDVNTKIDRWGNEIIKDIDDSFAKGALNRIMSDFFGENIS